MAKHNRKINTNNSWLKSFGEIMHQGLTDNEVELIEKEYPIICENNSSLRKKKLVFENESEVEVLTTTSSYFETENPVYCCNKNCIAKLRPSKITEVQMWLEQFSIREKDIFLLSRITCHPISEQNSRQRFIYYFEGQHVLCRESFLTIFKIGDGKFKSLQNLSKKGLISPPLHGNCHRCPRHAISNNDSNLVITFIENYSL